MISLPAENNESWTMILRSLNQTIQLEQNNQTSIYVAKWAIDHNLTLGLKDYMSRTKTSAIDQLLDSMIQGDT